MKIKNKIYTLIFASVVLFTASCSDPVNYNDNYDDQLTSYGPPSVRKIAASQDTTVSISEGTLTQMISIFGNNLTDITSIYINDVEVDLSTIYAIRSRITLPIPRVIPMEVDNQIKITTKLGTTSTTFKVNSPELKIDGFYNEFAHDGDTVKVVGKNFDLYEITKELATLKLNGADIEMVDADAESFSIAIPKNTPYNSVLSISTSKLETSKEIRFRDRGYPILSIEDPVGVNGAWLPNGNELTDGTRAGDPKPLVGKYFRIHGTYGAWDWVNVTYARFDMTDADIINNPQNYYVKYEINNNIKYPLGKIIRIGRPNDAGLNYEFDPTAYNGGVTLNTYGQWKTVTFELLDLFKSNVESEVGIKTCLQLPANAPDRNHFIIVYQPEKAGEADFSVTNFRIVKK